MKFELIDQKLPTDKIINLEVIAEIDELFKIHQFGLFLNLVKCSHFVNSGPSLTRKSKKIRKDFFNFLLFGYTFRQIIPQCWFFFINIRCFFSVSSQNGLRWQLFWRLFKWVLDFKFRLEVVCDVIDFCFGWVLLCWFFVLSIIICIFWMILRVLLNFL